MIGRAPIRRTIEYLEAGRLVLKDSVKILSVNYNVYGDHHRGARYDSRYGNAISNNSHHFHFLSRDFVFWKLPQIQQKNPYVQIVTFKNMTPSPFIKCFFGKIGCHYLRQNTDEINFIFADTGHQMLVDIDSKSKEEIYEHLIKVVGKSK